jgi:hypothetical protein
MAASKKTSLGPTKKVKPVVKRSIKSGLKEDFGYMKEGAKIAADVFIPRSKSDLAWMVGTGVAGRAVGGITKAGKKFVNKVYRNMGK